MASSPPTRLPELAVDQATGEIRDIYASIEAALGVKLVNLVYRHLATFPGALEWAWAVVGGTFRNGVFGRESVSLLDLPGFESKRDSDLPRLSLNKCGVSGREAAALIGTLDAYNRANPMNALSLRVIALALADGDRAPGPGVKIVSKAPLAKLLPMGSLDDLTSETAEHLGRLAFLTTGREGGLMPSLYRHFIPWPILLAELGDWLERLSEKDQIVRLADRVASQADTVAAGIYAGLDRDENGPLPPDGQTRDALSSTISLFLPAICNMIVIGGIMRRSVTD